MCGVCGRAKESECVRQEQGKEQRPTNNYIKILLCRGIRDVTATLTFGTGEGSTTTQRMIKFKDSTLLDKLQTLQREVCFMRVRTV